MTPMRWAVEYLAALRAYRTRRLMMIVQPAAGHVPHETVPQRPHQTPHRGELTQSRLMGACRNLSIEVASSHRRCPLTCPKPVVPRTRSRPYCHHRNQPKDIVWLRDIVDESHTTLRTRYHITRILTSLVHQRLHHRLPEPPQSFYHTHRRIQHRTLTK